MEAQQWFGAKNFTLQKVRNNFRIKLYKELLKDITTDNNNKVEQAITKCITKGELPKEPKPSFNPNPKCQNFTCALKFTNQVN